MRAARIEVFHEREAGSMVTRARMERTFLGPGLFAAVNLLFVGFYLLREVNREPLKANDTAVIAAGFALALATFLLAYLVWPWCSASLARHEDSDPSPECWEGPLLRVYGKAVKIRLEGKRELVEGKKLPGPM
ncbi:MAG: hypothetical protein WBL63_20795 [Candidatus Acidiferrum sp.]